MTNNNFEKRIQEKLNQFEVEPSENLLDNIFEKRVARSKGALNFSYFKLGVAMLSLAIITVVIIYNSNSTVNNPQLSGNDFKPSYSDNQLSESSSAQVADNESNSTVSAEMQTEKSTIDQQKTSDVAKINKPVKQNYTHEKAVKKLNVAVVNASDNKKETKTDVKESKVSDSRKLVSSETSTVITGSSFNGGYHDNGYNIEERYFNQDAKNRPMIAEVYHKGNSHLMVYHAVDRAVLDNLNLNYMFLKPMRRIPSVKGESDKIALIDYKTINNTVKRRKPLYVDLLMAPVLSFHKVSGSGMDGYYHAIAKSDFNKQYNLRVSYPVSRSINVFAGIGYMNLVTSYKGEYNYSEPAVRVEIVTKYINDPILGTIEVKDTVSENYIKNSTLDCNFKNSYDILTIPIGLSYNFGVRKFDFGVHGSALLNVYASANGRNTDFVKRQTSTFSSEKKHIGLGAGISFMVAYKLNNKFKLIAEPGLQYFRIDGGKTGNSVNERILNSGLNIGLRYTLY